jgi:hypothetical protein
MFVVIRLDIHNELVVTLYMRLSVFTENTLLGHPVRFLEDII